MVSLLNNQFAKSWASSENTRRYPRALRVRGKCDMVLWEGKEEEERPLVAIEVKEDIKD